MLVKMFENNERIDEVVMFDTGWEFPEMYEHIEKVKRFTGLEITTLHPRKPFDYWMFDHVKTKGNNIGQVGYGWPEFGIRWCTSQKRDTIKKYLNSIGEHIQFIGLAFDETKRPRKSEVRYYLDEIKMTENKALQYCYDLGFDWGGLYKLFGRVSCKICPLKDLAELYNIWLHKPLIWADIKKRDSETDRNFRNDYTIEQLETMFSNGFVKPKARGKKIFNCGQTRINFDKAV